jgi:hypothetical protein
MGEAKRRGTFEERRDQAIAEGRGRGRSAPPMRFEGYGAASGSGPLALGGAKMDFGPALGLALAMIAHRRRR